MACEVDLAIAENDPCASGAAVIGKQIVGLLIQNMTADPLPIPATLASVQAALTDPDDPMVIIKNLAAATTPEATDQTLTGNDVPYGTTVITDRTRTIVAQQQYLTPADVATNNTLNKNQTPKRVYAFDDKSVLQGPYDNASVTLGAYVRSGAGQPTPNRQAITVTANGLDEPAIGTTPLVGIASLVNA